MKALIFLVLVALIVSVVVWRIRKTQAEEALAKRKSHERRKNKQKEAMTPEIDMTWPVIVKPVRGDGAPGDGPGVEEPSMTSIEFESSEKETAKQG
jgi:hypothetical protein